VSNTRRGDDRWCAITVFDDAQWAALGRSEVRDRRLDGDVVAVGWLVSSAAAR
jgi:hypothetical protein